MRTSSLAGSTPPRCWPATRSSRDEASASGPGGWPRRPAQPRTGSLHGHYGEHGACQLVGRARGRLNQLTAAQRAPRSACRRSACRRSAGRCALPRCEAAITPPAGHLEGRLPPGCTLRKHLFLHSERAVPGSASFSENKPALSVTGLVVAANRAEDVCWYPAGEGRGHGGGISGWPYAVDEAISAAARLRVTDIGQVFWCREAEGHADSG